MWPTPGARPRTVGPSRRNYRLLGQERGTRRCDRFVRDGLCQSDHPRSRRSCEGKEPGEIGQDGKSRLDVRRGGPSIWLISVAYSLVLQSMCKCSPLASDSGGIPAELPCLTLPHYFASPS